MCVYAKIQTAKILLSSVAFRVTCVLFFVDLKSQTDIAYYQSVTFEDLSFALGCMSHTGLLCNSMRNVLATTLTSGQYL